MIRNNQKIKVSNEILKSYIEIKREDIKKDILEEIDYSVKIPVKECSLYIHINECQRHCMVYKVKENEIYMVYKIPFNKFISDDFLDKIFRVKEKLPIRYSKMLSRYDRFRVEIIELIELGSIKLLYNDKLDIIEGNIDYNDKYIRLYMNKDVEFIDIDIIRKEEA